jgi:hypothetical protein
MSSIPSYAIARSLPRRVMPTLAVVSLPPHCESLLLHVVAVVSPHCESPLLHVVAVVSPHCESPLLHVVAVVFWPLSSAFFFEDVKMLKIFFGFSARDNELGDRDHCGRGLRRECLASCGTCGSRDRIASALRGEAKTKSPLQCSNKTNTKSCSKIVARAIVIHRATKRCNRLKFCKPEPKWLRMERRREGGWRREGGREGGRKIVSQANNLKHLICLLPHPFFIFYMKRFCYCFAPAAPSAPVACQICCRPASLSAI